jgi:hypothetical protein
LRLEGFGAALTKLKDRAASGKFLGYNPPSTVMSEGSDRKTPKTAREILAAAGKLDKDVIAGGSSTCIRLSMPPRWS